MICISTEKLSGITIIGHALEFESLFCDLRVPSDLDNLRKEAISENEAESGLIGRYLDAVVDILEGNASIVGDSEMENCYIANLQEDNWRLRALVALNGKYNELTSKDFIVKVRICTVQSLLNDRIRGVERKDISWLDDMVNDSHWSVREMVATYGKREHLDALLDDKEAGVRMIVASHGIKEHLDVLASDDNANVRQIVRQSGDKTHHELVAIKELSQMKLSTLMS